MIKSMTGFGRGEAYGKGKRFTVELKAVNHRFNETFLRMPRSMISLEEKSKRVIQEYVSRGRIDGFFSVEVDEQKPVTVKVDKVLAESYYKAIEELQTFLELPGKPSFQDLVNFPDVLTVVEPEEDVEQWWPYVKEALIQAITGLVSMRETEGERLAKDLKGRINSIGQINEQIEERAPLVVDDHRQRLESRLKELIKEGTVDQERLANEVAIFAERSNITEEVVRLNSHLYQAEKCLGSPEPVGRKMDFLVQEMNREINTIGSKANDLAISRLVVEVKSEVEKIREQVQNIE